MKLFLSLAALIVAVSCSSLQFVSLPKSISLPAVSTTPAVSTASIPQLNANILGLSAKPVDGFAVESDLFSRPRALATVRVDGVDSVGTQGASYVVENNGFDVATLDQTLAVVFGADRESVKVSDKGISGSALAKQASEQKVSDDVIKTKLVSLRTELEQVYRLAAAISAQGAKFAASDSADIYQITISGMAVPNLSEEEKQTAISDINNAIQKLTAALSAAYGDQAVVEVISISSPIAPGNATIEDEHNIRKRDASTPTNEVDQNLKKYREMYNVSVFTGTDYPAIFAIFVGLIVALVLAVLYTTVGMMTMDPGRDSIIYRMTTTRMKKD